MKYFSLLLLLFIFLTGKLIAQTKDSIVSKKTNTVNYYSPFHKTNDSATSVSKLGHYISVGSGALHTNNFSGVENLPYLFKPVSGFPNNPGAQMLLASYSLAYKSHLFSATFAGGGTSAVNATGNGSQSKYFGLLYGQSLRYKHFMVSASAGLALTYLTVTNDWLALPFPSKLNYEYWGKISVPIEVKAFYLARNGVGVGIHLAENIVTTPKYSPFYAGLTIVFGMWNKPKAK